jgi:DNA-directed RNA polymerase sigma subunit (sigma70/sigma32)
LTLEQVGSRIGVTKERVRQVQKAAIAKLKWYIEHDSSEGFDTEAVLA